jgi:hypothetical protein
VRIQHLEAAPALVDRAISQALAQRKPVYMEVCCNLPGLQAACFTNPPVPYVLPLRHTNRTSLQAAVAECVASLRSAGQRRGGQFASGMLPPWLGCERAACWWWCGGGCWGGQDHLA